MTYRIVRLITDDFGANNAEKPSVVTETVIWSGPSAERMSEEYPPSNIYGADPLDHSEIEDGLICFDYRFEQGNGEEWEKISDPRVRPNSDLTETEKAQNAENRRLYPGDYYGTPCVYCGSSTCLGGCYVETYQDEVEFLDWCDYCGSIDCGGECEDDTVIDHDQGKCVYRDSH